LSELNHKKFPNIEKLFVYELPIKILTNFLPSASLFHLDFDNCQLESFSGFLSSDGGRSQSIPVLPHLEWLLARSNGMVSLEGFPSSGLENLKYLLLADNKLETIEQVVNAPNLEWLILSNNRLVDISPVTKLHKLKRITLYHNKTLKDISPLFELTITLEQLSMNGVLIDSLTEEERLEAKSKIKCQTIIWTTA